MASFEQYASKIEQSIDELPFITGRVELAAAQEAYVQLLQRTFATGGTGVRDIYGNKLSAYSDAYAKKRLKHGRQVQNKDLVYSSDTSVIKDNIMVGMSGGKPAMGHLNERGYLISTYQEEQNNTKIFQLNDTEKANVTEVIKEQVMSELSQMVKKWRE